MFDELAVVLHEHLLDQIGMVEKENRPRTEPGPYDVTVLSLPACEGT
jgi:hypothetical protein